jgi:hypothetical protein
MGHFKIGRFLGRRIGIAVIFTAPATATEKAYNEGGHQNETETRQNMINPANKYRSSVMPDPILHPVYVWIPAFAGMTCFGNYNRRISYWFACHTHELVLLCEDECLPDSFDPWTPP